MSVQPTAQLLKCRITTSRSSVIQVLCVTCFNIYANNTQEFAESFGNSIAPSLVNGNNVATLCRPRPTTGSNSTVNLSEGKKPIVAKKQSCISIWTWLSTFGCLLAGLARDLNFGCKHVCYHLYNAALPATVEDPWDYPRPQKRNMLSPCKLPPSQPRRLCLKNYGTSDQG